MEADEVGQIMLIYIEKVLRAKWTNKVIEAKSKKCVWWTLDPPMPEHIICLSYTYDYKDNTTFSLQHYLSRGIFITAYKITEVVDKIRKRILY